MNLRKTAIGSLLASVAVVGMAWGGYALFFAEKPAQPTLIPEPAPAAEKPKSDHPPIAKLRDRMLLEFHGVATNVFTSIPGFGFERMTPMYKKIPFEIPYLSTAELEIDEAPKDVPEAIKPILDKSRGEFASPTQPKAVASDKKDFSTFGPQENGLGHKGRNNTIAYGIQLRMLDLVGLTDKEEPRVYSGGQAFELVRMNMAETQKHRDDLLKKLNEAAKKDPSIAQGLHPLEDTMHVHTPAETSPTSTTRTLDSFEVMGVAELAEGKDVFIRAKGNVTRMLGALRAGESCLKCHTEAKQGDLLGAFSYTFVDTSKRGESGK